MELRKKNSMRSLLLTLIVVTSVNLFGQSTQLEDSNGDIRTISSFTGNFGIGTLIPSYKLTVSDGTEAQIAAKHEDANNLRLLMGVSATESYIRQVYSSSSKPFHLKMNNTNSLSFETYDPVNNQNASNYPFKYSFNSGLVDVSNSTIRLPNKTFYYPDPEDLDDTDSYSFLFGKYGQDNKLVPQLFIHHMTDTIPENEFIINSYYHPALVLNNINEGSNTNPAEGSEIGPNGRNGYQTSVNFWRETFPAWQVTSDYLNDGEMHFAIREWKTWNDWPKNNDTHRFIIKSVLDPDSISIGELTYWQNAFYGNTGVRGFLSVKAMNSTDGRAAFAFEGADIKNNIGSTEGIKRWIRQGSDPKSLEISDLRNNGKTFWSLYGDGIKSEMTVQNDDGNGSNRLRMILGADSSQTYIKQLYHTSGRPFLIKVNNAVVATFDVYSSDKFTVNGDARANNWYTTSDKRFKKDIKKIDGALDAIRQLDGMSYKFDDKAYQNKGFSEVTTAGFIAQDFLKIFPEFVKKDKDGFYAINYVAMVPVLTEAMKELSEEKKGLEKRIEELETKLNNLASSISQQSSIPDTNLDVSDDNLTEAFLKPNSPNPFTEKSTLSYHLPQSTKQASLFIYDLNGTIIKTFENLNYGQGQIEIEANSLSSGIYLYTLIADGREIGTHKMILKK